MMVNCMEKENNDGDTKNLFQVSKRVEAKQADSPVSEKANPYHLNIDVDYPVLGWDGAIGFGRNAGPGRD